MEGPGDNKFRDPGLEPITDPLNLVLTSPPFKSDDYIAVGRRFG